MTLCVMRYGGAELVLICVEEDVGRSGEESLEEMKMSLSSERADGACIDWAKPLASGSGAE